MFVKDTDIRLPAPDKMPRGSHSILRWVLYFCAPYKTILSVFIGYRIFRYIFIGLLPLVFGVIIEGFETGRVQDNPSSYITLICAYFIVYFLVLVTNQIFSIEASVYERIIRSLTLKGVQHLNSLSLIWHEAEGSGGKIQRVMGARKALFQMTIIFKWILFPVIGNLAASFFIVFTMDAPLYFIPLYILFSVSFLTTSWIMGRKVPVLFKTYYQEVENLMSGVYEFVGSIRTVKALHLQSYIETRANELERKNLGVMDYTLWKIFTRWATMNFVSWSWMAIFAGLGFYLTYNGQISVGAYATIFFTAWNLLNALEHLGVTQDQLYDHTAAMRRFIDMMNVKPVNNDSKPAQAMPQNWGTISFNRVNFIYPNSDDQGVENISFTVKRGQKIAFVGESGAGKTTLAKLLMKQVLPDSGEIKVDDTNLNYIPSRDWLSQIGFVPQDVELFNLSVRDNILIDRQDIEDTIYQNALKQAALFDFIQSLPDKDETIIGERGIKLSGGQRQRLGIARALVRQAEIIVFDEATSALDSISEKKIQKAMDDSFSGHTVFVIAHRLSTVRQADQIIVLDEGKIIEHGDFESLRKKDGQFARLWSMQSSARKAA